MDFNCRSMAKMFNKTNTKTFFNVSGSLIAEFTEIILENKCDIIERVYTDQRVNITISSSSINHINFVEHLYNKLIKETQNDIK